MATTEKSNKTPEISETGIRRKRGSPKGSRNAAKVGRDLKYQMYMSKVRRGFFEEYFELKFGRPAQHDDELRDLAR